MRLKLNKRNLAYLYYLIITNLLKEDLIPLYNEISLNEFIKNTFEVFDKKTERDVIISGYQLMNINVDRLIDGRKNSDDESD